MLHDLGVYGGAQGVWVDAERTRGIVPGSPGLAVGLLHTGRHYEDDLDDEGILYHYPSTRRAGARDRNEIQAIRDAGFAGLPMFVITEPSHSKRSVRRAWFVHDNPRAKTFYLAFRPDAPPIPTDEETDERPFSIDDQDPDSRRNREALVRKGQARFRQEVVQRYGPQCAVCSIDVTELLDAAHLKARARGGTNDPRNGLLLCKNHHRALDAGVIGVRPDDLRVVVRQGGPSHSALHIEHEDLGHLTRRPAVEALEWLWEQHHEE